MNAPLPQKIPLVILLLFTLTVARAQHKAAFGLEAGIQNVVARSLAATVMVSRYDSSRPELMTGVASGVVVSADGLVLTAGHVSSPNRHYKLKFVDGKEAIAKGLGKIGRLDVSLMKIIDSGSYAFAEMGWSSSLKVNEPCISIGHPGSFKEVKPIVRFGYVAALDTGRSSMIRTTCIIEPGDSGGPLFDLLGRVVGINSLIHLGLEDNYEVPIDQFRKYWTALQQPVYYRLLPPEEAIPADPMIGLKPSYAFPAVLAGFSKLEKRLDGL